MQKLNDVIMVYAPQISGLKANQILEETRKHKVIDDYMSDIKEGKLSNRNYVVKLV